MIFKNYEEFKIVSEVINFCDEHDIHAQNFGLENDEITEKIVNNQQTIFKLMRGFLNIDNQTQKEKLLQFLKHVIVDNGDYILVSNEHVILRFIYYVNEFHDFQKISYRKDFLNFNPNNYYKEFTSKGKIRMINLKGPKMDKNNRYFIIKKDLFDEFKEFTNENYFFELDINRSYIYSNQRKQTRYELPKTNLSDVLEFVKRYHRVGFDLEKAQVDFEYYEYLISTYFEYYTKSPETLLEFLGHKIEVVNDVSSDDFVQSEHDIQYYLSILK